MKESNFSRVLKIEEHKLNIKKLELSELLSNLNICKEQLVFYNTKVEKYKVVENLTNQIIMDYLNNIIEKSIEIENKIVYLEEEVNIKIQEIVSQNMEIKKYEKLVEMKEEEYKQSIQKREQKELDDILP